MLTVLAIAGGAAVCSVAGGALALARRPTTLLLSIALGLAAGVLLATVTTNMLPEALAMTGTWRTTGCFALGFAAMWAFELYVNRGYVAGPYAAQIRRVAQLRRRVRPRGDRVTVLAGGTSVEEIVEGIAIGAGTAVAPDVGVLVGVAIAVDNLAEGLSIGELVVGRRPSRRRAARRVLGWTAVVGGSLLSSALVAHLLLRDAAEALLGALLAGGAGGMLYLVVTQLIPPAEERQYQESAALAIGGGFLMMLLLVRAAS